MKVQIALLATGLTAAYAQLSSGCTGALLPLAVGDLGSCLQLTQIIQVLGTTSGSVIPSLNTYLTSLCSSSTPQCSNSTLTSANTTIANSCASDLSSGGSAAATVQALELVLTDYPYFYAGGCAKNTTTNDFCVVDILYAVQNSTNTDVTFSQVAQLLSGSGTALSQLTTALNSGQLCTGCVSKLYQQAVAANATIATLPAASSLKAQCGSSFGSSVSGVSSAQTSAAQTSSSSSSSGASASSTSRAAGFMTSTPGSALPLVAVGMTVLAGIVAGGSMIL